MTMGMGGKSFRVGERVRVRLGLREVPGTIVEDRGFLGSGGSRLLRIMAEFDQGNTMYMEVPEEQLKPA